MKILTYLLSFALFLGGCGSSTTAKNEAKTIDNKSQEASIEKRDNHLIEGDNSKYDTAFIAGIADYPEPYKLIDNFIITGQDTTFFPEDIPINQKTTFKGVSDQKDFLLTVTRTNLTNLTYTFALTDKRKNNVYKKSGIAVLGSMFFLASEVDEDSEKGDSYGSSEYQDNSNNCWFSVRMGMGLDHYGKQRAMVTYGCKDKNQQNLNLEECPTLRTE